MGQSSFPTVPPVDVSRNMDRDQMLYQLGIEVPILPPRLQDPDAPEDSFPRDSLNPEGNWTDDYGHTITRSSWGLWNNYHDISSGFFPGSDTLRLGSYTPIDLLKMKDGTPVTTADVWWHERREEILQDVEQALYGAIPPESILPEVTFSVISSRGGKGNASYLQKEITGTIDLSRYPEVRNAPVISATLRIPADATESVPVMVRFGGGFSASPDSFWETCYPHGWGICIFNPGLLQPDNGAGLTSYLIGLVNKGMWRKPSDWGTIAAWSWGISKLIDYFEKDEDVDASRIGITGHSRYGKATLVTMAYEPRLAIAFPSDAGSLGTKMNRRHWGQDLENSTGASEYHWMAGNFFKWAGELVPGQYLPRKIENCPVDAHSLLALCAPRPVLINGGTRSSWTDPYGMYLTTLYATPVYELLGTNGIVMSDQKPVVDKAYISGGVAFRYHDGGHTDAPEWPAFFEFADRFIHASKLMTSSASLTLSDKGQIKDTLYITCNTDWKVTSPAQWLRVSPESSSGNGILVVTADANYADTARSGILMLTTRARTRNIEINQSSARPFLSLSDTDLKICGDSGSNAFFMISSNTAWDISSSEEWLTINKEAGINNKKVIIEYPANPAIEARSASVSVSGLDFPTRTLTISQSEGLPTLNVRADSIRLTSSQGSNRNIWITSNSEVIVECSHPWVKASVFIRGRFSSIVVTAEENQAIIERIATLTVKVKGLPAKEIAVVQSASSPPQ